LFLYWLPAQLVTRVPHRFEAWLRRTEAEAARLVSPVARRVRMRGHGFAELAYLCCYPLVPAAFLVVDLNGSTRDIDRFWTSVLAAGYVCYISLPWLVSRPPRALEAVPLEPSRLRRMNVDVLDRFSHGWNTFPSGHVAVAFAAALTVVQVAPYAGVVFVIVAGGIAIGSVSGRYHYTVDAIAGLAVGLVSAIR
jgi:membrane-associated phospholipid phosphatase